ncbi:hypothetical protein MMC15_000339 [Xylographa vitiligo]|nr:hypothetical protein [Xylographa vitiligo]
MSQYKPTEHDGLKQDGTPDKRVGTGEFAHGQVDPVEAGKAGGQTSGSTGDQYKPTGQYSHLHTADGAGKHTSNSTTENDGLKKDGNEDGRVGTGEFAHGQVDPVEAGKAGGKSS